MVRSSSGQQDVPEIYVLYEPSKYKDIQRQRYIASQDRDKQRAIYRQEIQIYSERYIKRRKIGIYCERYIHIASKHRKIYIKRARQIYRSPKQNHAYTVNDWNGLKPRMTSFTSTHSGLELENIGLHFLTSCELLSSNRFLHRSH